MSNSVLVQEAADILRIIRSCREIIDDVKTSNGYRSIAHHNQNVWLERLHDIYNLMTKSEIEEAEKVFNEHCCLSGWVD